MMSLISSVLSEFLLRLKSKPINDNESHFDMDFLPPELLAHILSFVHPQDLVNNCRFVCNKWNQVITDKGSDVWKRKILLSKTKSLSQFNNIQRLRLNLHWHVTYQICVDDPFGKNLLRNNCGRWVPDYLPESYGAQFENWELLSEWEEVLYSVVRYPRTYEPFPQPEDCCPYVGYRTCFLTNSELRKQQTIDLYEHSMSRFIMDEMQPKIIASEWFSGTENDDHIEGADAEYLLRVSLLSSNRLSVLQEKEVSSNVNDWEEHEWKQVTLEFENYGPDVRYVVFHHYAKQDVRLLGTGTRIAGGVVKVVLSIPPIGDRSTIEDRFSKLSYS